MKKKEPYLLIAIGLHLSLGLIMLAFSTLFSSSNKLMCFVDIEVRIAIDLLSALLMIAGMTRLFRFYYIYVGASLIPFVIAFICSDIFYLLDKC